MNINDFAREVTLAEGLKKSVSIAQVKEVLRITNNWTKGELYRWIKNMPAK